MRFSAAAKSKISVQTAPPGCGAGKCAYVSVRKAHEPFI